MSPSCLLLPTTAASTGPPSGWKLSVKAICTNFSMSICSTTHESMFWYTKHKWRWWFDMQTGLAYSTKPLSIEEIVINLNLDSAVISTVLLAFKKPYLFTLTPNTSWWKTRGKLLRRLYAHYINVVAKMHIFPSFQLRVSEMWTKYIVKDKCGSFVKVFIMMRKPCFVSVFNP